MTLTKLGSKQKVFGLILFLIAVSLLPATLAHAKSKSSTKRTFRYQLDNEPLSLHPLNYSDAYAPQVLQFTHESLLRRSSLTYDYEPSIAESFKFSKDGLKATFHLRKGVRFHNGDNLTAQDVKFTIEAIKDKRFEASRLISFVESISDIKIIDPYTIDFYSKTPVYNVFYFIAEQPILPKSVYEKPEISLKLTKHVIGTGPYKLKSGGTSKNLVLEKNSDWWGLRLPTSQLKFGYDEVEFIILRDSKIALLELQQGHVDYLPRIKTDDYLMSLQTEKSRNFSFVKAQNRMARYTSSIALNNKSKLFNSKSVRRALCHLVDKKQIVNKLAGGLFDEASGPWYSQNGYADPKLLPIPYDPVEAEKLMKSEGWVKSDSSEYFSKEGKIFEFDLLYGSKDAEKYYIHIQNDFKKFGIKMNLKFLEWGQLSTRMDSRNFEALAIGWTGDIEYDPKQIWHSTNAMAHGSNFVSYSNSEVDQMIDQSRVELDKKKRVKLMKKIFRQIAEDAPYIFLFSPKYSIYARSHRVDAKVDTLPFDIGYKKWVINASP